MANYVLNNPVIGEFFRDPNNAELLNYIKAAGIGAGAGMIIGTIVEDFATLGAGVVDDWTSFYL